MTQRRLNTRQEEELVRLVAFERDKCSVDGRQPYHCAFPFRPTDRNQMDLVKQGMLEVKRRSPESKPFVVISALGYAFVEEREAALAEMKRLQRHDVTLVLISGAFACLCTIIGILVGRWPP